MTLALAFVLAAAAANAGAGPAAIHLALRHSTALDRPAATAAYVVDDSLVDVSMAPGRVELYGRSAGRTQLAIVSASGVETLEVQVDAPPPYVAAGRTPWASPGSASSWFQSGFDSQTGRLGTELDSVSHEAGGRLLRLRVASVTGIGSAAGVERGTALPALVIGVETAVGALVLGDQRSDLSPLTIAGATLRGVHLSSRGLLLHAGWSSATLYEDLLLPAEREAAAGVSYQLRRGASTLMPSLYVFPDDSPYGGARGAFGAMQYGVTADHGRLDGAAEIGWGGRPAAAGHFSWKRGALQGRLEGRRQPSGSASLGLGRPHGTFAAADASARLGSRLTLAGSFSLDRSESSSFSHSSDAASAELRYAPTTHWRLRLGTRVGSFAPAGSGSPVRTTTLPLEAAWTGSRASASALYRYQEKPGAPAANGGRLAAGLHLPRLRADGYVDWQPSAVSIASALSAQPGLARALAELGLSAQTPDELARLLRENAALVDLGGFDPASVRFDALRRQLGLDLSWTPRRGQRLSARVLLDRTTLGTGTRRTTLATLAYSREIAGFELLGSVSVFSRDGLAGGAPSFRVAVRRRFDGLPSLPRLGERGPGGVVFRDDAAAGRPGALPSGALGVGVPGVEVRLGARRTVTDAAGRFHFAEPGHAGESVEVVLPPGAYFTTASSSSAAGAGAGEARFGLAFGPARLAGRVRDDAGRGLAGLRLTLSGPGTDASTTTDSEGRFAFARGEGEYVLELVPGSVPPGYSGATSAARALRLSRQAPLAVELELVALRSLAGRVTPAPTADALVCLSDGRCVSPAADGRYALRGVRAGAQAVVARAGGRTASRAVNVPPEPGALRDVDLVLE